MSKNREVAGTKGTVGHKPDDSAPISKAEITRFRATFRTYAAEHLAPRNVQVDREAQQRRVVERLRAVAATRHGWARLSPKDVRLLLVMISR